MAKNTNPQSRAISIKSNPKIIHFIGIGGIGISSLAQWFLAKNWVVSGSDIKESGINHYLAKKGVKMKIGHKKANLPSSCRLVIYSQAIPRNNPELQGAKHLNIKTFSYSQAVGFLTKQYTTIAVAGAHGKSTTAALVSLILIKAGLDPTVIIGTKLKEFHPPVGGNNFRLGKSGYLVLEADEWRASFLDYSPAFLIITNIDREHLDFYKNLQKIKKTFLKFISQVNPPAGGGGAIVLNKDDENLFSLKSKIQKVAQKNNLKLRWYSLNQKSDVRKIKLIIKISGEHNVSNALAALNLARLLKISDSKSLKAISMYRGSWRRMEYRGGLEIGNWPALGRAEARPGKLEIFDDYAHHPTEIKATLKAFREKFSSASRRTK